MFSSPKTRTRIIAASAALIVILHVLGTIYPGHAWWGFHLFSFYGPVVQIVALLLAILLFVPAFTGAAGNFLERFTGRISKYPLPVVLAGLAVVVIALSTLFSADLHLLGDGAILLRSLPAAEWGQDVISSFRNQPLLSEVFRLMGNLGFLDIRSNPAGVYEVIDGIAAVLMLLVITWSVRAIDLPPVDRFLLGCLLFFGAGSQFFFGYVENYVLLYVVTAAFAAGGWLALEGRVHVALPLILFALLPGLHLGTVIFLPAVVFLVLRYYRDRKMRALAILGAIGAVAVLVLFAIGFDPMGFMKKMTGGSVDFLPLLSAGGGIFAYPLFSVLHLLDWFNAQALIVPFGIFLPAALLFTFPKNRRWNNPPLAYLMILTLCGILFTWIINPALGMARDWDLLAGFFVPLMVLDLYLLAYSPGLERRRSAIVLVTGLTFLHWAAFIGINADGRRHLERMKRLADSALLSSASMMAYDEALANYFNGVGKYDEARNYYEDYLRIDSSNTRILGNISEVYRNLGARDLYFNTLKRAAALNSPNPGIYSNLGVQYALRGDTARAFEYCRKTIEMDSNYQSGYANLGVLYFQMKDYPNALRNFLEALRVGSPQKDLYLYTAESAASAGMIPLALKYYDLYLKLVPGDRRARERRDRIRPLLRGPEYKKPR